MKRYHLAILLLCGCVLSFSMFYLLLPKQQTPSLSAMSKMVQLAPARSLAQAEAWQIPLEPQSDKGETHTHVALRIYWNGAAWPVPDHLGFLQDGRALAIHTHAADGIVHLHLPKGHQPFRLSQILQLWGLPLENSKIDGQPLTVWKDGKVWQDGLDQPLPDHADLIVEIGSSSPGSPLTAFDWSAVPLKNSH